MLGRTNQRERLAGDRRSAGGDRSDRSHVALLHKVGNDMDVVLHQLSQDSGNEAMTRVDSKPDRIALTHAELVNNMIKSKVVMDHLRPHQLGVGQRVGAVDLTTGKR
jgi:hypothetical protein